MNVIQIEQFLNSIRINFPLIKNHDVFKIIITKTWPLYTNLYIK